MKNFVFSLLFLLLFSVSADEDAGGASKDFEWMQMPFSRSRFLVPQGWFFTYKAQEKGDAFAYFITMEHLEKLTAYETGLSIKISMNVPKKSGGLKPSEYAAKSLSEVEKKYTRTKKWEAQKGVFKESEIEFTDSPPGKKSITIHRTYIANDVTGTIYILTFEGPADRWDDLWKEKGEVMMKNFSIDEKL